MRWWEVRSNEDGSFEARRVNTPSSENSQWRWVQLDWNDGSRSCFCSVVAPWKWLAILLATKVLRMRGCTGKRWKEIGT